MSPLLPVTDKCVFPRLQEAGVEYRAQSPASLGKGLTVTLPSVLWLWRLVCFGDWGFMVALDLAVASPRQDEFPGSLIPLFTSPIQTQTVRTSTHASH